ncbi:hypothetical protein ILYODFUR_022739 [Ilyodon furcidens]|uniref:Uncharacterized protein n=1 Tax=Ilyodon furcidens TaxID=33524 RepID=A0ABV0SNK0_9TELE
MVFNIFKQKKNRVHFSSLSLSLTVESCFAANCCYKSFGEKFTHSFLQHSSSSARLDGQQQVSCLVTNSKLDLGLEFDLAILTQEYVLIPLAVILGSLSCWKVNLIPSLIFCSL